MGAQSETRCQKTSSVAGARGIARPRARAADDLSAQGSGLRARQAKGGSHAPEIPTPMMMFRRVCVLLKRKKQKARPKGVNLKVPLRAKVAMRDRSEESAHRAILVWECRDRSPIRSVGKGACVCECGYDPTPGQGNP